MVGDFIRALPIGGFVVLCNTPMMLHFIYQPPTTLAVTAGNTLQETVLAIGSGTITYLWYLGVPTTTPSTTPIANTDTIIITDVTASNAGEYYVIATDAIGDTVASTMMTVTITPSMIPSFTQQPPNALTVVAGRTIHAYVQATGGDTIYYTWYMGVPTTYPNTRKIATTDTLTINNATPSNDGEYYVVATNSYGVAASTSMTVTVSTAITFTQPPPNTQTVVAGGTLSVTVRATRGETITYAWYMGSPTTTPSTTPIAKTATLTINNVTASDAGEYYAVATNEYNNIVASTAMKVIIITKPVFSAQPPNTQTVVAGGTLSVTVLAIGAVTIKYAWYKGVPTTTPSTPKIAKTATLTITDVTNSDTGEYYAVASNNYGVVASTSMMVTIMPVFSTQPPTTLAVVFGGTLHATVLATGGNTITYAWYMGLIPTTNPSTPKIATTPTLTINNMTVSDTGVYYVVATNEYNNIVASRPMMVTIIPVFSTQPPTTLAVITGGTLHATVLATGGNTITYAWYKGLVPTTNPTTTPISKSSTLTITGVTSSDIGGYYAVATNDYNNIVASTLMMVTIMPVFSTQPPTTLAVVTGSTIQETVQATGGNMITYAWYKGLVPTTNPTTTPIVKSSTLTITGVTASNAGNYYAVATNGTTAAVSTVMAVVVETVLTITTQPAPVSFKVGKVATFTVAVSGGLTPYTYVWYQNGTVVSGATTATYTIMSPTKAMNASHIYVKISDSCTTPQIVTSNTVTLTVKPLIAWWLWALIAAIVVVVVIIIIVVIIIVIHHKKLTNAAKTPDIPTQQPVPPPITSVGQPNYGFNPTLY